MKRRQSAASRPRSDSKDTGIHFKFGSDEARQRRKRLDGVHLWMTCVKGLANFSSTSRADDQGRTARASRKISGIRQLERLTPFGRIRQRQGTQGATVDGVVEDASLALIDL